MSANDFVTRDEFNGAMQRFDARVISIEQSTSSMKEITKTQAATVEKMYQVLYGENQNGVLFLVANLKTKMGLIQWITAAIAVPLIGIGINQMLGG